MELMLGVFIAFFFGIRLYCGHYWWPELLNSLYMNGGARGTIMLQ